MNRTDANRCERGDFFDSPRSLAGCHSGVTQVPAKEHGRSEMFRNSPLKSHPSLGCLTTPTRDPALSSYLTVLRDTGVTGRCGCEGVLFRR